VLEIGGDIDRTYWEIRIRSRTTKKRDSGGQRWAWTIRSAVRRWVQRGWRL